MTPEVAAAVDELKAAFPNATVEVREEGDGVIVFLNPIALGAPYAQPETWIGFRITFQYPYSDVYPLFVRGDLSRTDGQPLGEGTATVSFEGRHAVQLSRKSNRLDPESDTAVIKVHKVLAWLMKR